MAFIRGAREGSIVSARRRRTHSHFTAALVLVLVTASLTVIHAAHAADLDRVFDFNIESQTLDKALLKFGAQAHLQIMFAWDSTAGHLQAPQVRGKYTARQALKQLLKGTQLAFDDQGNTVEITASAVNSPVTSLRHSTSNSHVVGMLPSAGMAQMDQRAAANPDPAGSVTGTSKRRSAALDEVIVTAEKYTERAINVPISLTVISGYQLQQQGITDLQKLQFDVPGLYVQSNGVENRVALRGVSDIFGQGALVGEYIDDADATASPELAGYGLINFGTFDLQRVEVLRGPQGTLYGEGSMGGTIRFITNKPDLRYFGASADATQMFTQDGAPSQQLVTVLNAPLVGGKLGLRVAADVEHDGGWINMPADSLKGVNSKDLADVRIEALARPVPHLDVLATQEIERSTFGLPIGTPGDNFVQVFNLDKPTQARDGLDFSNLDIKYDLLNTQLSSSSTYFKRNEEWHNFGSATQVGPQSPYFPPSPDQYQNVTEFLQPLQANVDQSLSEEIRAVHASGVWHWTVGAFYKNFDDEWNWPSYNEYIGKYQPPGSPLPPESIEPGEQFHSDQLSAYGNTSYNFYDRWAVGAGVRYFQDKEVFTEVHQQAGTFTSVDPRFYAQYRISRNMSIYSSAAKGFRSGTFNALPTEPHVEPESLWTYELGEKGRLMGGTLREDVDVFYTDWKNYTLFGGPIANPAARYFINAGVVHIKGTEGDVTWLSASNWKLSFSGDYINGRFVTVTAFPSPVAVGDPVDETARFAVTASAERDFVMLGRSSFFRLDYSERAPESYRSRSTSPYLYSQSDYLYLLDVTLGVQWSDHLSFQLFGHNILNDQAYIDPFWNGGTGARTQPITVGFEFYATL